MSKEKIYAHFGEDEQLKRLALACVKLAYASEKVREKKTAKAMDYLVRKLANVEFLTEQVKDYHKLEEGVYCHKYKKQTQLQKEIDAKIK